jgi:hypothetical protein
MFGGASRFRGWAELSAGPSTPGRRKQCPAPVRETTSGTQEQTGRKRVRRNRARQVKRVEPEQGPQTEAGGFISTKRPLSAEAREVLAKVDTGGIPFMMTLNLERIAGEHGIEVGGDMTPNDLVRRLRELA